MAKCNGQYFSPHIIWSSRFCPLFVGIHTHTHSNICWELFVLFGHIYIYIWIVNLFCHATFCLLCVRFHLFFGLFFMNVTQRNLQMEWNSWIILSSFLLAVYILWDGSGFSLLIFSKDNFPPLCCNQFLSLKFFFLDKMTRRIFFLDGEIFLLLIYEVFFSILGKKGSRETSSRVINCPWKIFFGPIREN